MTLPLMARCGGLKLMTGRQSGPISGRISGYSAGLYVPKLGFQLARDQAVDLQGTVDFSTQFGQALHITQAGLLIGLQSLLPVT